MPKIGNPLHTFPRNFLVDGEAANFLQTCCLCCGLDVDLIDTGKSPTCYGLATGKLV